MNFEQNLKQILEDNLKPIRNEIQKVNKQLEPFRNRAKVIEEKLMKIRAQ